MSCYKEGNGFKCSCDGYELNMDELTNAEEMISREQLKAYKFDFIKIIKGYSGCTSLYGYHEVMAHIENVGVEINIDDPCEDVLECMSYWD